MKLKAIILNILCATSLIELAALPDQKLHLCTVVSFQNQSLDLLRSSALSHGMDLEVIGLERPLKNGFTKLYRIQEYLKTLPDSDIVLYVDAFNTLILGTEEELLEHYRTLNTPCIFSAEKALTPKDSLAGLRIKYPSSDSSFKYLDSGAYMGRVGFLKLMIDEVISNHYQIPLRQYLELQNDQLHLHRYYAQNPTLIKLDTRNALFLTLSNLKPEEVAINEVEKSITVVETTNKPLVIHRKESGEPLYEEIAKWF